MYNRILKVAVDHAKLCVHNTLTLTMVVIMDATASTLMLAEEKWPVSWVAQLHSALTMASIEIFPQGPALHSLI